MTQPELLDHELAVIVQLFCSFLCLGNARSLGFGNARELACLGMSYSREDVVRNLSLARSNDARGGQRNGQASRGF